MVWTHECVSLNEGLYVEGLETNQLYRITIFLVPSVVFGTQGREDSIWSFHVWNEMYYARGNGQEWQAGSETFFFLSTRFFL